MKRRRIVLGITVVIGILTAAVAGWTAYQAAAQRSDTTLAQLMPEGAVLFLEAKNFSELLGEWNASPEKQTWLKSDNHQVFSRSRLLLRLEQAQGEFTSAAGVPPNMNFLAEVAGERSALGIYDIGKLELLYVTRQPSARVAQGALWQKRSQFESRQAAGQQFFVRTEPQSGRVVAFAVANDYLLLATREDLLAGALTLIAGQKLAPVAQENWFTTTSNAAKQPGDLRMVINLAKVSRTPQFRGYWVQRNVRDLQQYESSISDLYRSGNEYREERVLFRAAQAVSAGNKDEASEADEARSVADLLRFVTAETDVYRAFTAPPPESVLAMLEQKILAPRLGVAPPGKLAPNVTLGSGAVGTESDLETRIDVPPAARDSGVQPDEALKTLLTKTNLRAVLQLYRSEITGDGVFVKLRSALVLSARSDWDDLAVRAAVQKVVAPGLSTGGLGAGWKQVGSGAESYSELDGLGEIAVATRGKYLVISNDPTAVTGVLRRLPEPATAEPVYYAGGFNHARARQKFYHLTSLVDRPNRGNTEVGDVREPEFFSGNVTSLSQVFAGIESESITVRHAGLQEMQTVRYRWSR